jgi:hypothetical protein
MCEMAIAANDVDKTMAMYVLFYFDLQCLLSGCCSVALPDSTENSLAVIRSNIKENMIPSQVLLSSSMIYAMSDLCCMSQNLISPPASHLGSQPIQMTTSVAFNWLEMFLFRSEGFISRRQLQGQCVRPIVLECILLYLLQILALRLKKPQFAML